MSTFSLDHDAAGTRLRKDGGESGVRLEADDLRRRLQQGRRLLLGRACVAGPGASVLDCTAGFGLDGLTLAALGCTVTLAERHPLVFELLQDGVARLQAELPSPVPPTLLHADARELLRGPETYDVIYLDPIFPERRKSALPHKRARLLTELVGHEEAPTKALMELVTLGLSRAKRRVVVKRRRLDPEAGTPDFCLKGRSVRFDVYQPRDRSGSQD